MTRSVRLVVLSILVVAAVAAGVWLWSPSPPTVASGPVPEPLRPFGAVRVPDLAFAWAVPDDGAPVQVEILDPDLRRIWQSRPTTRGRVVPSRDDRAALPFGDLFWRAVAVPPDGPERPSELAAFTLVRLRFPLARARGSSLSRVPSGHLPEEDQTVVGFDDLYRQGDALTWQAGKEDVVRQVVELLMVPDAKSRILDFGCGTGWTADILATGGARYLGVDPSAEGIAVAQRTYDGRPNIRFHQLAIHESLVEALHGARFTHIFALDALYFASDLEGTLAALREALEENGQLTTISHIYRESRVADSLIDSITLEYGYPQFLSGVQWSALLKRARWRDVRRYRFYDRHPFDAAAFLGHPAEEIALARRLYEHEGAQVITARR